MVKVTRLNLGYLALNILLGLNLQVSADSQVVFLFFSHLAFPLSALSPK